MEMTKKFETKGKNKEMLAQLKSDIKEAIEQYCKRKKRHPRQKEEEKNTVGQLLMKIAELATLRYRYNYGKSKGGIIYDINADDLRDLITQHLWRIIKRRKQLREIDELDKNGKKTGNKIKVPRFDAKRLIQNNSTYSFFMKCANIQAMYEIRKSAIMMKGWKN